MSEPLGVGLVGSGFVANFHVQAWQGVRHADLTAVYSRNAGTAQALADDCRSLGVGDPTAHGDLAALVRDPKVDALWITSPNHIRVETIEAICEEVRSGRAELVGIACEKPLARTVKEARQIVEMVEEAGLLHGYLENQVFAPGVTRARDILWQRGAALSGSPYLARCAEEHSGPHRAWFWSGQFQGGGVLNDMMCHSVEASRHLLSKPGDKGWLTPRAVSATIASLKWSRPDYADALHATYGDEVDYHRSPAEDYARSQVTYSTRDGDLVVAEASTSWSYVGAGLRITCEVLGPEYSMAWNTLDTEAKLFLSRRLRGEEGEDLVEKQNAEQGLMPIVPDEAATYGYTAENRVMVDAFRARRQPPEDLHDGLLVVQLLMACYLSAQEGQTLEFPVSGLEDFVPEVAKGTWQPRDLLRSAHRWN